MVPSALRTMSVVTMLSAVSGTVLLMNHHNNGATVAAGVRSAEPANGSEGDSSSSVAAASLVLDLPAAPVIETAADQAQLRKEADRQQFAARRAEAREQALKKARAKARAEAAAQRRREQIRERATRSARRDPQAMARIMAADRGWGSGQFSCLKSLWTRESGWNYQAKNPSSGAYGIPQSLPGRKMATAGADWQTNPVTQIRWGLDYIADRYGTPCGAWGHSEASGWY